MMIRIITFIVVLLGLVACRTETMATLVTPDNPPIELSDLELERTPEATVIQPTTEVSTLEADLRFMREEEKLAHDVYVTLYDAWGLRIFNQIAQSETTHTNAVAALLTTYGIADPAEGKAVGEFADPTLQALYDELVAEGLTSLDAALMVGATIEEIDILDLETRIATTTQTDVVQVYTRLLNGSENHLRAFVRQLGDDYTAQYLEPDVFDAIVGTGNGQRRNGW